MSNTGPDKICEASALECVRLARMTNDPELREELFKMARDWMAVATKETERVENVVSKTA